MMSRLGDRRRREGSRLGEAAAAWSVSRRVRLGRREIRYRDAGTGPPIILVHGLGVSADYWVRNGPALAGAGFRVLAPDLPGFGRSDGLAGGMSIRAQADAVRAWALALDLPPAVYLGHSLSCQSILELAAVYPDSVTGLILAAPTGDGPERRRLVRQAIGLARDIFREPLPLATLVGWAYLRAGPARVLSTWRLGAKHDPLPLLDRISVPGLVVLGERDPIVDRAFADRLADGLRGGRVVVIPGTAHAVIFDGSGAFNLQVARFVAGIARLGDQPAPSDFDSTGPARNF